MSIHQTLSGEGIPDIESFLAVDQTTDKTPMVVNTNVPPGVQENALGDMTKLQLLNPHNQVETLVGNITAVKEMGEIADNLSTKEVISFNDAENVNLVFENFKSKFRLSEFTQNPSKTNLAAVQKFVTQEVRLRKESAINQFSEFVLNPFAELQNSFQELNDNIRPTVLTAIESFSVECLAFLSDPQNLSNQEFVQGNDTLNFATTPVRFLPKDITTERSNVQLFMKAVDNLCDAYGSDDMTVLSRALSGLTEEQRCQASLLFFIQIFASPELPKLLGATMAEASSSLEELKDLVGKIGPDTGEFVVVRDFLVSNQKEMHDSVSKVRKAMNLHHFVRFLYLNTSVVLGFFTT